MNYWCVFVGDDSWHWTIRCSRRYAIAAALDNPRGFRGWPPVNQMTKSQRDSAWRWLRKNRNVRVAKCKVVELESNT